MTSWIKGNNLAFLLFAHRAEAVLMAASYSVTTAKRNEPKGDQSREAQLI